MTMKLSSAPLKESSTYSDDFHYQTLTPLDPNGAIITWKQFAHQQYLPFAPSDGDGSFEGWFRNDGPNRVAGVIEGGKLFGSWRAKGEQTIADGASIRFDGWSWPGCVVHFGAIARSGPATSRSK
jgi:hypothetical protein